MHIKPKVAAASIDEVEVLLSGNPEDLPYTKCNGTAYDLVFSPDPARKFIYMIDGMNGECASWAVQISLIVGCYTHGEPGLLDIPDAS